ncbi:MAG TPA: FkbM family methyltransferase [bacterium]|nr:FkbM family methyltransferase [bacterium]
MNVIGKVKEKFVKLAYPIGKSFWNKPGIYRVRDGQIFLDPRDGMSAWKRRWDAWEPQINKALQTYVKEGDHVIQFGSCMGYDTLTLAKVVGEKGRVIGVEPFPRYFSLLKKTYGANKKYKQRVKFINVGYSRDISEIEFTRDDDPYSDLGELNDIEYGRKKVKTGKKNVKVDTISIKKIINVYGIEPTVIYMDIEGGELKVFDELLELLLKLTIIWEHHSSFYGEDVLEKYLKRLANAGYKNEKVGTRHYVSIHAEHVV